MEKAFDKAFQLEDCPDQEIYEGDTVRKQSANVLENKQKFKSGNHAVLTAIEPLSLPSVTGSKANLGLFGTQNSNENTMKNQGIIVVEI